MVKEYSVMLGAFVGFVLIGYAFVNYFHLFPSAPVVDRKYISDRNLRVMEAIKKLEAREPSRITGNETEEEIRNNPYIRHIRTALNGYLDGSNTGAEDVIALGARVSSRCGLRESDKVYYKSKFFLYKAADNDYGGVQAYIVFVDKPDTIFWAWVYKLGGDAYSLRGFCKSGPFGDLSEEFIKTIKDLIERGEIKFVL